MNCQCQGIEQLFNQEFVNKELRQYRAKGPDKTTRMLTKAIREGGVDGLTLLDIGGGVGAIQYDLLAAGVQAVTSVEASTAYISAAQAEAARRGVADRISYQSGNFVDLAAGIAAADIVTLDRVICCYPDMEALINLSASRAHRLVGLVYPRDRWWVKAALALENFFFRLRGSPFRTFVHSTKNVEAVLEKYGFKCHSYRQTFIWQVVVFTH